MRWIIVIGGLILAVAAALFITDRVVRFMEASGTAAFQLPSFGGPAAKGRVAKGGQIPPELARAMAKRDHYDHIREIDLPSLIRKTAEGGRFFIQLSPKWCCACWGLKNYVEDAYAVREGPAWLYIDPDKCGKEDLQNYLGSIGEQARPKGYPTTYLVESGRMVRKLYGFSSTEVQRVLDEEAGR